MKRESVDFLVIGGTFRDVAIRASSTRDIDVVLIDRKDLPDAAMRRAGFLRDPESVHAWRYRAGGRTVELQVAALASSEGGSGPFSTAARNAEVARIEGLHVKVPRIEDFVILKLLAAEANPRRRARDLADVQYAIEAYPEESSGRLSIPALRARMRNLYAVSGRRLKELTALLRALPRAAS